MNLLIFGPQASGKGTQAKKVAEYFEIPHISTGDMFRDNIKKGTELGKLAKELIDNGNLVPDNITNNIVKNRLKEKDCKKGFILDGYPRTRNQAEFLDSSPYIINAVINLEVSEQEVIKRISSRRVCEQCGENYNLLFLKPEQEGICNNDGGKLIMRDDDKPESIKKRLDLYHKLTEPLQDFYKQKGIIKNVNGEKPIAEVFDYIIQELSA